MGWERSIKALENEIYFPKRDFILIYPFDIFYILSWYKKYNDGGLWNIVALNY